VQVVRAAVPEPRHVGTEDRIEFVFDPGQVAGLGIRDDVCEF